MHNTPFQAFNYTDCNPTTPTILILSSTAATSIPLTLQAFYYRSMYSTIPIGILLPRHYCRHNHLTAVTSISLPLQAFYYLDMHTAVPGIQLPRLSFYCLYRHSTDVTNITRNRHSTAVRSVPLLLRAFYYPNTF